MSNVQSPLTVSAQQVIDNMMEGVLITDANGLIQSANPAFRSLSGYSLEELVGRKPEFLSSARQKPAFFQKMAAALERTGHWQGEIENKRKDGDVVAEWVSISAIRAGGAITHYIGVFTDLTKKKRAQEMIRHMAHYDPLTDLPNRTLFRESLNHAISESAREETLLGVMFLDLDRVKLVNNTLGHDLGDQLLIGVAERLKKMMKPGDVVARLGGDEFMLLFPRVRGVAELGQFAERILEALKPPFYLGNHELFTTASIGVSIYPLDGRDGQTLLKNADTAMYRAKRVGRNNFQMFHATMNTEVYEQLALGNGLRRALERKEFVLHYQPQLDIQSGEIVGMEALVRWQHPDLGMVYPTQFIQWAEDSGLIIPLGEMVMTMACEQTQAWQKAGLTNLKIAVNLSATQFHQSDIVETVSKVLKKTGLPADSLELELTESVVMELSSPSMRIPHELRAMGISFSIDDFGTGYSSLNYLKRFPANTLKMDQSFVHDLTVDPNDAAIATAVIALGHGLDLSVIAEGVETENQFEFLRQLKCDRIQGFLLSEPLPPGEFEKLMQDKSHLVPETLFS